MDINDLRGFSTVLVLIAFVGICWWAFAPRRKARFDEAANLPFADDHSYARSQNSLERQNSLEQTKEGLAAETKQVEGDGNSSASSGNEKRDTL